VPIDTLYRGNNLENNPVLKPGRSLVIPFCGWSPPLYAKSPDQYGVTPIKDCPLVSYSIQQGDTLEAISAAFNIPVASIIKENQLENSSILSPGKSIVISLCKNP
jgi:LysM repeat protein